MKIFMLSFLFLGSILATEPVTLTNREGRSLQARIVQTHGDNVQIQTQDGRLFTLDVNTLDDASQKIIREVQARRLLEDGIFQVTFNRRNLEREIDRTRSAREQNANLQHIVTVTNTRAREFPKLEVRYMLYHFSPQLAAPNRDAGTRTTYRGTAALEEIGQFGSGEFEMEPVEMRYHRLQAGWRYAGGGRRSARDTIEGIWIRFYENGLLVGEFQQPTAFFRNREWNEEYAGARALSR
ncbi:MAG: hypothetical protein JJU05_13005 [Verrucomicrobia bacterium]|nr:hypothetical protein [Verrucomicrobiota bacterium]MCH8528487.1 hypothetical protein [Kiritimatiellia bacterium]